MNERLRSHRGGTVLALGILALVFSSYWLLFGVVLENGLGVLLAVLGVGVLIGLPLGIIGSVKANRDLRDMEVGVLDPSGRLQTQAGKVCQNRVLAWWDAPVQPEPR